MKSRRFTLFLVLALTLSFGTPKTAMAIWGLQGLYLRACGFVVGWFGKTGAPAPDHDAGAILILMGDKLTHRKNIAEHLGRLMRDPEINQSIVEHVNRFPVGVRHMVGADYIGKRRADAEATLRYQKWVDVDSQNQLFKRTAQGRRDLAETISDYQTFRSLIDPGRFLQIDDSKIRLPAAEFTQIGIIGFVFLLERNAGEAVTDEKLFENLNGQHYYFAAKPFFIRDLERIVQQGWLKRDARRRLFYTTRGREQLERAFSLYSKNNLPQEE